MGGTLALPAQVDHRVNTQRGDRCEVLVGRLDMVPRTEQQAGAYLPAAAGLPAAIVAEIVNAPGLEKWFANHARDGGSVACHAQSQ